MSPFFKFLVLVLIASSLVVAADTKPDGNRFGYLDYGFDLHYPHKDFPKLTTPQWVGEKGVEAVVVLSVNEMRETAKYETYLRPVLDRMKQIDGRAPVSIMASSVKVDDPQLQNWLREGLSIECQTTDMRCPLLHSRDHRRTSQSYNSCVDHIFGIAGNIPVAFRAPCSDVLNSVSPRFLHHIYKYETYEQHSLQIDSSVFTLLTRDDASMPRELVTASDGKDRFRKYLPHGIKRGSLTHDHFINFIENYPYPYVVGQVCWEFPCVFPSAGMNPLPDGTSRSDAIRDLKAALDCVVAKQGVFNLSIHPESWLEPPLLVELIDYAASRYGKKVKFLTFRESLDRLNQHVLLGESFRHPKRSGHDAGVRVLDLNEDGFMDVIVPKAQVTRVWQPQSRSWRDVPLPFPLQRTRTVKRSKDDEVEVTDIRWFQVTQLNGPGTTTIWLHLVPAATPPTDGFEGIWHFSKNEWKRQTREYPNYAKLFPKIPELKEGGATILRDLDHDGRCELIVQWYDKKPDGWLARHAILKWQPKDGTWQAVGVEPPPEPDSVWSFAVPLDDVRRVRFIDVDQDGFDDVIYSSAKGFDSPKDSYCIRLFDSMQTGWSRVLTCGVRDPKVGDGIPEKGLPRLKSGIGYDNGCMIRNRTRELCWQNEHTAELPDFIFRVSLDKLIEEFGKPKSQKTK